MGNNNTPAFGQADATFQAAGGEAGIRALVDDFYDIMDKNTAYATIRHWHPADLTVSRDKLACFLCGWMGGPRLYQEKYGAISIPGVHAHLQVGTAEMNMWLDCMGEALALQHWSAALCDYLREQLARPADMIRRHTEQQLE